MQMPALNPVSRRELVRKLKRLGFEGPFAGGKHQWMRRGAFRLTIPNPHGGAIDPGFLRSAAPGRYFGERMGGRVGATRAS
jgi:predicted RNA binding protein YcfA (HicA-like mRNA interferase family)